MRSGRAKIRSRRELLSTAGRWTGRADAGDVNPAVDLGVGVEDVKAAGDLGRDDGEGGELGRGDAVVEGVARGAGVDVDVRIEVGDPRRPEDDREEERALRRREQLGEREPDSQAAGGRIEARGRPDVAEEGATLVDRMEPGEDAIRLRGLGL
ncbi:MAG: hypothetical protein HY332_15520 [Chloroflexi bacterium]|nr:hypothetical protein [Chloroflexota bacterium]